MHEKHNAEAYKRTAYFSSIDTKPFEGSDLEQSLRGTLILGQEDDKVRVLRYKNMAMASETV